MSSCAASCRTMALSASSTLVPCRRVRCSPVPPAGVGLTCRPRHPATLEGGRSIIGGDRTSHLGGAGSGFALSDLSDGAISMRRSSNNICVRIGVLAAPGHPDCRLRRGGPSMHLIVTTRCRTGANPRVRPVTGRECEGAVPRRRTAEWNVRDSDRTLAPKCRARRLKRVTAIDDVVRRS
jgi:hypothetical protein